MGFCGQGPMIDVEPQGLLYEHVTVENAASIIDALVGGTARAQLGDTKQPFFARQMLVVRSNNGRIDPERLEDYLEIGGYQTLHHALHEMQPTQVIEAIVKSGLRGRGGAGYPTGLKWGTVSKPAGAQKFVICNGDEGDPGAYMDRSVLESDPHRVLEGMAIAGYAVGANRAFIYVRAEYPLAVSRLQTAIRQAKQHGLLGAGIFESTFNFDVDIRIGAGALSVARRRHSWRPSKATVASRILARRSRPKADSGDFLP
jgi:bidirectional [NiFe] hydrogenase diaphorase subunit